MTFSLGCLLSSVRGMAGAVGANRGEVERKVYQTPALPLAFLKGHTVEEAEGASRKAQVFPCWFLPETSCKAALVPGTILVVHVADFLCSTEDPQFRFTELSKCM